MTVQIKYQKLKTKKTVGVFLVFGICSLIYSYPAQAATPELPRVWLDTTNVPSACTTTISTGGDLQAAIDQASLGDTLCLQAGATFQGVYILRNKTTGSGRITIRTSASDNQLPAPGSRVVPSYSPVLAKIVSPDAEPAIQTDPAAHHYRLVGLEITVTSNLAPGVNYGVVVFGTGDSNETLLAQAPHDLIVDRCYIHGTPTLNVKRGIALNSINTAVIDSYISDIHSIGQDSQALGGWSGPGPFKIVNNHLEGAGENLMFGGAPSSIPGVIASDIEIRRNHFFKPWTWKVTNGTVPPTGTCHPGENYELRDNSDTTRDWYQCAPSGWARTGVAVSHFSVKNLFELKNAQRVLFDGNILENNWLDGQVGFGILFNGIDGPATTIRDITVTHNILRNSDHGFNVCGDCGTPQLVRTNSLLIEDNLFENIGSMLLRLINGVDNVTFNHNTGLNAGSTMIFGDGPVSSNLVFQNNIAGHGEYGVIGSGAGEGINALNTYFSSYVFQKNALAPAADLTAIYPPNNFFVPLWASIGFVNFNNGSGGDYHLLPSSPYKHAGTDGKDLGADIDAVLTATDGADVGTPGPIFQPPQPPPDNPIPLVTPGAFNLQVYPNPWRKDKHAGGNITFAGLPTNVTVKIFTAAGHLVRELKADAGRATWDLKNDSGQPVASGVYLYLVTDGQGHKKRGKVAIIR